ncbi:hypothetical protein FK531_14485 [Rhodococcus spelaei]|uniref:Lipoprotein n=1 Tax=Rhodococcus spelaei TaxID=2546320 RepID=A0A541B7K3_9NOCA|nr:hypothetical protein [Rhodococcus spelaei]TQF68306.1 hypothetical protein FK531_14485 [Rhodococcus spelaei]
MRKSLGAVRRFYGANPLHLLSLIACFAFIGYLVSVIGPATLWNHDVWWQSIVVWFVAAVIAHDLVLFPLYALADRSLTAWPWARHGDRPRPGVPPLNYVRVPALGSGLLLLVFLPGIIEQGRSTYLAATGQTQAVFLDRWLLVTAVMFGLSALLFALRVSLSRTRSAPEPERAVEPPPGAAEER